MTQAVISGEEKLGAPKTVSRRDVEVEKFDIEYQRQRRKVSAPPDRR